MSNQTPQPDPRYAALVSQYGNAARVPPNTNVIEYAHLEAGPSRGATVGRFILGMAFPIIYAIIAGMTLGLAAYSDPLFVALVWIHPIVFIALVIYIRVKFKWRAFLAGVLTMVLGAPLVFAAACAILLSGMKF